MKPERPAFHRVGRLHRHYALAISVEDAHLIAVFDKVHRKGVSLISETDHPDASDDEFDDSLPLACRAGWLNRGSLHHGISPSLWTNTATGEPTTLETSRSRAALSMTLRTSETRVVSDRCRAWSRTFLAKQIREL
jgi:hypothetical protein